MTSPATLVTTPPRRALRQNSSQNFATGMLMGDTCALALAITVAVVLRFGGTFDIPLYLKLVGFVPVYLTTFYLSGLYPGIALNPVTELQGVLKSVSVGYLLFVLTTFLGHNASAYSRLVVLASWALSLIAVPFARLLVRRIFSRSSWAGRAVIFTEGPNGQRLASSIYRCPWLGLRVVGTLGPESLRFSMPKSMPFLGQFHLGPAYADSHGIDYAILAMPGASSTRIAEVIDDYASRFRYVMIVPDLVGVSTLGVQAHDLGGVLGLKVDHRLLHRWPRIIKRTCDVLVGGLGLVALLPLLFGIWLAIRLTSSGSPFYKHERIGENRNTFKVVKFRTMVPNAYEVLDEYLKKHPELSAEWLRDQKLKNDPRVTTVGRFLRKTSLDELPQLWNVIKGDMSLVGPRPIVDGEILRYGDRFRTYARVRPGITGLWQVSGRNNTTYEERVGFDDYYVRNWSVWLDFYILVKTVSVVVTGYGAY